MEKLRAEVEKLKTQVKELEAKLGKLQADQPKAEEPKGKRKKGTIDLDQLKKVTDGLKGKAGKKGTIDIESLKKLAEILGNSNIDIDQIMKLMELQKQPAKKQPDKKPEDKKPDDKQQPKPPSGATSIELRMTSFSVWVESAQYTECAAILEPVMRSARA